MCVLLLILYFVIFVTALGELYLSRFVSVDLHPLNRADIRLYPTAQDDSPAVRLSLYLYEHMSGGLTLEELKEFLLSKDDVNPRINDLLVLGYLTTSENETLQLTQLENIYQAINNVESVVSARSW